MSINYEPFDELDVMSNYLMNALASDPEIGEPFARLLIRKLIGKEVGEIHVRAESIVTPRHPGNRGVRLDIEVIEESNSVVTDASEYYGTESAVVNICDFEPHRQHEEDVPRKHRYRQASIDSKMMKKGKNDFTKIPGLYIVNILNYDPFDKDNCVYSFEMRCEEFPDMCYDYGVTILYFNTEGKHGGNAALRGFLKFLEHSTADNIVDEGTEEMAHYVEQIKARSERRDEYMTLGEYLDGEVARLAKEQQEHQREEITKRLTEEITERVTEEVTERVTEEVTERVTEEVTERVTEEVTERVTEEVTERVVRDVEKKIVEKALSSGKTPEEIVQFTGIALEEILVIASKA